MFSELSRLDIMFFLQNETFSHFRVWGWYMFFHKLEILKKQKFFNIFNSKEFEN